MDDKTSVDKTVGIVSVANDGINTGWQCKICTLINDNLSTYCDVCNNPRDDGNNIYDNIQKLVLSLVNQSASQVTFLTCVNVHL